MAEEQVASSEEVFSLPAEALAKLEKQQQRAPTMVQVQIPYDPTPISQAGRAEILQTASGPIIQFRRETKTVLYRADGTAKTIAIAQRQRLLNKRDAKGNPQWFTNPPVAVPANVAICRYCFKKFRPSTALEISQNAARAVLDEEALRLLKEQYPESNANDKLSMSVNDVGFKLAEHIRVRHGRLAAFVKDPMYNQIRGVDEQQAASHISSFAPTEQKRGRGRPRKA